MLRYVFFNQVHSEYQHFNTKSIVENINKKFYLLFILSLRLDILFGLAACQVLSSHTQSAAILLYSATLESSLRRVSPPKTILYLTGPMGPHAPYGTGTVRGDKFLETNQFTFDVVGGVISPKAPELLKEDEKHET